ncbi:hypothetical protein BDN71DRAFT_1433589 [Pleurotus eryngii]|uniref:Uncharacterized protein n=1 Tax=Pleurotus eryngii TaxID=5323 RepID=A0A9P5ZPB6_PLEER|nr:hypothetical protein BDN71DRAFT_1433589 [Pleurotus eryngii]
MAVLILLLQILSTWKIHVMLLAKHSSVLTNIFTLPQTNNPNPEGGVDNPIVMPVPWEQLENMLEWIFHLWDKSKLKSNHTLLTAWLKPAIQYLLEHRTLQDLTMEEANEIGIGLYSILACAKEAWQTYRLSVAYQPVILDFSDDERWGDEGGCDNHSECIAVWMGGGGGSKVAIGGVLVSTLTAGAVTCASISTERMRFAVDVVATNEGASGS